MSSFEEMGFSPNILKGLDALGFENPTEVQAEAIPFVLKSGRDLVALAQTGTGKTAAFSLPIIHKLDLGEKSIQALILCPTRELCIQITRDIASFTKFEKKVKTVAVYGGASMEDQIRELRRGCQIVVGTPGRVRDMINRRKLDVSNIQYLVLDEADEMLNMGFKEELDDILSSTPSSKQALLFSATMPYEVESIANNYMEDPAKIEVGSRNSGNSDVTHVYCVTRSSDRYRALKRIVDITTDMYGIVFCRTRAETKEVADWLMNDGYQADALHGDLSQAQRDYVMNRFRKKTIQILVATDVAARGIDVNDLTHVLNYKIPDQLENYVHRSGRTGRAGKKGISIALITGKESYKIRSLERIIGQTFERRLIPTGEEVCQKSLFGLIQKIASTEVNEAVTALMPTVYEQLESLTKEEVLQKFVSLEFNRVLKYYKNAGDLNVTNKKDEKRSRKDRDRGEKKDRRNNTDFARFYINVGAKQKITAPRMIGLIKDSLSDKGLEIGKIEILKGFSFFEIEAKHADELMGGFKKGMKVAGVEIVLERAEPAAKSKDRFSGGGGKKYKRGRDGGRDGGRDYGKKGKGGKKDRYAKAKKKKRY